MNTSTMAAIREEFEETPAGTPIPTSRLLRHGTRGAVDQTLSRLMRQGEIKRATRGVYYRPKESRLIGATGPGPQAVVEALTESRGEAIAIHGAEAARQLGLTTQASLSPTFLTSGRTKTVQMGKLAMRLQHASPREMALAGRPAGTALSALRYLGPSQVTPQVIAKIRSSLPPSEFVTLREETGAMPSWLSDAFFRFEHSAKVSSANEPQLV